MYNGGSKKIYGNASDPSPITTSVLIVLALASIFSGFMFKELFIGFGSFAFSSSIFCLPRHSYFFLPELLPVSWKLIPFFFSISGIILAFFSYYFLWPRITTFIFLNKSFQINLVPVLQLTVTFLLFTWTLFEKDYKQYVRLALDRLSSTIRYFCREFF
jgi:hypothetical protein